MKIHSATVGMLCLATLTVGACVKRSTYNAVIVDLKTTKAEIENTGTQSQGLTEQVGEFEDHKIILARQMEVTSSALQQARQEMETEAIASQERLSKLNRMISQLTVQQSGLKYALQRANEERPALQSRVDWYKSKLSEGDGPRAPQFPPPVAQTNERAETALAPPAQAPVPNEPASQPTGMTPAAPPDPTAANQKPQRADKQTSEPVEDGWLSMLKEWVVSLWRSIFS